MTKIVGIINPARRHARAVQRALVTACRVQGWPEPSVLFTTMDSPGFAQARHAVDTAADRVVVAGGDGTVRHVAAGLKGSAVVLGIIPTGTANLFALNIGLPIRGRFGASRVALDVHAALQAPATAYDVGTVTWVAHGQGRSKSDARRAAIWRTETFLAAAGLGKDAAAVAQTTEAHKGRWGWLAYLRSGARHLLEPPAQYTVETDGRPPEAVLAWTVLWANTARIPAGIKVFPFADPRNGSLEMLCAHPRHTAQWAGVAWHGLLRQPERASALTYRTIQHARVSTQRPLALQLDGDAIGTTSQIQLGVQHQCLQVAGVPAKNRKSFTIRSTTPEEISP